MAVRSIIDIAVNDGAFKSFAQKFAQYQAALPATVQAWQQAGARMTGMTASMRNLQAASGAVAGYWRTLAASTASVASSLKSATESLLRWTSLTTVIGGVLGVGSLFGLDRLAHTVGQGRREAERVGTTAGQQQAFELTYGRFLDPGFLNRISTMANTPGESWALRNLGATREAIKRGDAAEIARQILPALADFAKREATTGNMEYLRQAFHIPASLEELKALQGAQPGELAGLAAQARERARTFGVTPVTARKFQDFENMLTEAGKKIETAFTNKIVELIPSLTQLSKVLSDLVVNLIKDVREDQVKAFAEGIKAFATTIGSPEFKQRVEDFVAGVGRMTDIITRFVSWFGKKPETPAPVPERSAMGHGTPLTAAMSAVLDVLMPLRSPGVPLPVPRPHIGFPPHGAGYRHGPSQPTIGMTDFDQYWNSSVPRIKNQSSTEVHMTLTTPAGASMPRASTQIGSTP